MQHCIPIHSMYGSMYGIYAYIDPPNHPNVGIYMSYMERRGYIRLMIMMPQRLFALVASLGRLTLPESTIQGEVLQQLLGAKETQSIDRGVPKHAIYTAFQPC